MSSSSSSDSSRDSSPRAVPPKDEGAKSSGFWGSRPALVLMIAVTVAALWGVDRWDSAESVCGKPIDPDPAAMSASWWLCPIEHGRRMRPVREEELPPLFDIEAMPDGHSVVAVGDAGTLLHSVDSGQTWNLRDSHTDRPLRSVTALGLDGKTLVAVGSVVVRSADGGQTWNVQDVKTAGALSDVIALGTERQTVVAMGDTGQFARSADGGQTWRIQDVLNMRALSHVTALGDNDPTLVAVGSGGLIVRSADGGLTWLELNAQTKTILKHVTAIGPGGQTLVAVGGAFDTGGEVLRSVDGGQTWSVQDAHTMAELYHVTALTPNSRTLVAVGGDNTHGVIVRSTDGGLAWSAQDVNTSASLRDVTALGRDGQTLVAVGGGGAIVRSADGGVTWSVLDRQTGAALYHVTALGPDGRTLVAAGDHATLLLSRDGGVRWKRISLYQRGFIPTSLALGGLIFFAAFSFLALHIVRRPELQGGIANLLAARAIADSPITRADEDMLDFRPVVTALSGFLRHRATIPSLVVAITAPWGRGKSSMMRLLEAKLRRNGLRTIWFNVWHHQKEPILLAALLNAIVDQASPPWLSVTGLRFRTRLVWKRFLRRPVIGAVPLLLWIVGNALFASLSVLLLIATLPIPGSDWSREILTSQFLAIHEAVRGLTENVALESLLGGDWSKFAHEALGVFSIHIDRGAALVVAALAVLSIYLLLMYFSRPFPERPSVLLSSLGSKFSVAQAEDQTEFRQRFRAHFRDVTESLRPNTLTVFIDDLDRCEPAKAVEILEATNYLTDAGVCFVVLGLSREVVEAQVGEAYHELADRQDAFELARSAASQGPPAEVAHESSSPWGVDVSLCAASLPATVVERAKVAGAQLEFARRYLAKLIQVEVPVPAFSPERLQVLVRDGDRDDVRLKRDALKAEETAAQLNERLQLVLRVGISWSLVAALSWQATDWIKKGQESLDQRHAALKATELAREQSSRDEAREYVHWLRREVSAEEKGTPGNASPALSALQWPPGASNVPSGGAPGQNPAASAAASRTPTLAAGGADSVTLARRSAQLDDVNIWLARMDVLQAKLRDAVQADQRATADELRGEIGHWSAHIRDVAASDPQYGAALQMEAQRVAIAARGASGASGASYLRDVRHQAVGEASTPPPARPAVVTPTDSHGFLTAVVPGIVLLGVLVLDLVLHGDGSRRVERNYKDALEACGPLLQVRRALDSPREAKRFLNLTRYLALRVNPARYQRRPWWWRFSPRLRQRVEILDEPPSDLTETQLVALAALQRVWPGRVEDRESLEEWMVSIGERLPGPVNFLSSQQLVHEFAAAVEKIYQHVTSQPGGQWPDRVQVREFLSKLTGEIRFTPNPSEESREVSMPGPRFPSP